ncbi:MAG: tRNA (guanosine(46)-N7)-methyltransferase TrmB [Synergistaceae bacterium]|jgi:tRNA (guanine-N7-)-methyltransferase|nr:tRNA (guanosine(46)-N7)-methyltransferase TrmB [Synergistaceae bacterium]
MKVDNGSILFLEGMALPLDLSRLSGGLPKANLEIGFGNGEFTVRQALAHPDTLSMGMEVSPACITRCARRASSSGNPPNLKILCADARFMMKECFADASLDRVVMNFPCPWPKTRHARRRVTTKEFADALAAVLKIGGVFELVTDEEWYALDAQEKLTRHQALDLLACETNPSRPVATKYERKWLEMGKNIIRLTVAKTESFTVSRQTWGFWEEKEKRGERTMHAKTRKPLPEDGLAFLFGASGAGPEDARWVFKKHYAAVNSPNSPNSPETPETHKNFLVETVSADGDFEQRYYLKVSARGGDTLVKLDEMSRVFLTPAVRFSVEDLARRLGDRD